MHIHYLGPLNLPEMEMDVMMKGQLIICFAEANGATRPWNFEYRYWLYLYVVQQKTKQQSKLSLLLHLRKERYQT